MKVTTSVSFVIPCFNESLNINKVIIEILSSIKDLKIQSYEIIIIDDGSTDNTYLVVKEIQKNNSNIIIQKNKKNIGYGGAIKKGFKIATKEYVMWIPGDNSHKGKEITKIIEKLNNYDFVTTYYTNTTKRNFFRRMFTKLYTPFLNFIFGLNLPYYNGLTIYKTNILRKIKIETDSFTFQIEIFVKLIKKLNINYLFVPTLLMDRDKGSSKAFKINNMFMVIKSITKIFIKLHFYK